MSKNRSLARCYRALFVGLGVMLLLTACSRPAQRRYFTMTEPLLEEIPPGKYPVDLWVKEVEIAPVFNRQEIVYRYSPHELQYYSLSRWADRPARMVSQQILRSMLTSGLFRTVVDRLGTNPPTHVLGANVLALEQLDSGDVWYAHVAMSLSLTDFPAGNVLWQYNFDERRPLNRQDLGLAVRAMSEIFNEQMSKTVIPQIDAVLSGKRIEPAKARPAGQGAGASSAGAQGKTGAGAGAASGAGAAGRPGGTSAGGAATAGATTGEAPEGRAPIDGTAAGGTAGGEEGARATGQAEATPGKPMFGPGAARAADAWRAARDQGRIGPDAGEEALSWKQSMQYASDPTTVPAGKGAIFLPALTDPDRESPAQVYQDGQLVVSGGMGRRIPVAPGNYQVFFGSGTLSQRMMREVRVEEGETTIVPPDWATLEVSVVNERFIPFRGSYEIIRMDDREYMGIGFGADEELGEEVQVWVLRPGLYKIVQPGAGYRARTDFATVQLQAGEYVPFNLVLDETSRTFRGAGVAEYEAPSGKHDRWSFRLSIGGNLQWVARSQGQTQQAGHTILGNLFIDSLTQLRQDAHLWTTRLEIEEGLSLIPVAGSDEEGTAAALFQGEFRTSRDLVYLNSIYTYQLFRWAGPYARVGLESHFFNSISYFTEPTDVAVLDGDGNILLTNYQLEFKRLGGPFSPLDLKQGLGANFQIANTTAINLDVRVGLGARQHFVSTGQLIAIDNTATEGVYEVTADNDYFVVGPEAVVVANIRPARFLQLSTEFDALLPFKGAAQFTWRNSANLRLGSYATLIYSLDLARDLNLGEDIPLRLEQSLQLQFSWEPF